jgi:hypothetical protein
MATRKKTENHKKCLLPANYVQVKSESKLGEKTEKLAFECYKQEEPDVKSCGLSINPDMCWLGCSPDGIVVEKCKILEIKCPTAFEIFFLNV